MFNDIYVNLDNFINILNKNKKIIRMIELKEEIKKDENIKNKLEMFRKESNEYSDKYILLKKEILDNTLIKEYKMLENELFHIILSMNKSLNSIIGKKGCN